jgi:hypothetical protein
MRTTSSPSFHLVLSQLCHEPNRDHSAVAASLSLLACAGSIRTYAHMLCGACLLAAAGRSQTHFSKRIKLCKRCV